MSDLSDLTCSDRVLLDLYGLMQATESEAAEILLLTLGLAVAADDLGNLKLCHNQCPPLTVKYLVHGYATEACHCVGVAHLGQTGDGSLHKVMRVG